MHVHTAPYTPSTLHTVRVVLPRTHTVDQFTHEPFFRSTVTLLLDTILAEAARSSSGTAPPDPLPVDVVATTAAPDGVTGPEESVLSPRRRDPTAPTRALILCDAAQISAVPPFSLWELIGLGDEVEMSATAVRQVVRCYNDYADNDAMRRFLVVIHNNAAPETLCILRERLQRCMRVVGRLVFVNRARYRRTGTLDDDELRAIVNMMCIMSGGGVPEPSDPACVERRRAHQRRREHQRRQLGAFDASDILV